ncbi:MAG TPA: hypothetical protein VMT22_07665 [Terriglobales bacterium]|jgi:flagellar biosynthesis/type III secretory pathway M-ring protein FliF/YscJ|nr:hypothetical protein [Terriglobales bacterium]
MTVLESFIWLVIAFLVWVVYRVIIMTSAERERKMAELRRQEREQQERAKSLEDSTNDPTR